MRHRQWTLQPTDQWLHDNPPSAAAAWASADSHRAADPAAARHAEQWETIFAKERVDISEVRANAAAAVTHPDSADAPASRDAAVNEVAAAETAAAAVLAGAADVLHEATHRNDLADLVTADAADSDQQAGAPDPETQRPPGWTAYADGSPAAAVGGRGVSTPPAQVLSRARGAAAAAAAQTAPTRQVQLAPTQGLDR